MGRREIGLVSSTLLLPATMFVAVTGLLSDALDLNEFVLHKYVGYTAAVLALVHVAAHWPSLVTFWTGRGGRRARAGTATTAPAAGPAPAAETAPAAGPAPTAFPAPGTAPGTGPASDAMGSSPRGIRRRAVLAAAGIGATGFAVGWLVRPADVGRLPGEDVGALYHRASTPGFTDALGALVGWGAQPTRTKDYPAAARFELPPVSAPPELSVAGAIERRRSLRDYADRPLTTGELSWLLSAASGITGPGGLRAAPSAGAQYPIETYVAVTRVEGIEPGIYHYAPADHALERLRGGTFGGDLVLAGLGQEFLGQAPVVVVLSAIFQRLRWRYRERAYRYALLEAGHIGQNVYLAAEAAGLGACAVGAFFDDAVNRLLEIDGVEEAALVLLPVGPR
jgi:SagB-type dehydrogenase family enzyme